jgi:hypothetical protein
MSTKLTGCRYSLSSGGAKKAPLIPKLTRRFIRKDIRAVSQSDAIDCCAEADADGLMMMLKRREREKRTEKPSFSALDV